MAASVGPARRPGNIDVLYGRNAVMEALRGRRALSALHIAAGTERQPRVAALLDLAEARGLPVIRQPSADLSDWLGKVNHQGVALEAGPFPYVDLDALLSQAGGRVILALDQIQDPQNLGALMRTAEATSAAGLLLPERRSAGITPAVVNASAGAVEHLPVALVTNLARAVQACKRAGYWAVALEAGPRAQNLYRADVPEPTILIVGSEGKGLGPAILAHADLQVELPMLGRVESLNAAVAGSITLYELLRRRQQREDAGGDRDVR